MSTYLLYIAIASVTIASPGPGVILTLSNTLRFGVMSALAGIAGVSVGTFCLAVISATSLGIIMATSAVAFTVLKYVGAAYLIYLGIKLWRSSPDFSFRNKAQQKSHTKRFLEGLSITLLNPKPIFFFMSLFPQFIDPAADFVRQFLLLALTFSSLVIVIHCAYGGVATMARAKLSSPNMGRMINKLGGGVFMCFGVGLAASSK